MLCPWLINTVIETSNRNSYNDSRRSEKQEFGKCHKHDCPFYLKQGDHEICFRAENLKP